MLGDTAGNGDADTVQDQDAEYFASLAGLGSEPVARFQAGQGQGNADDRDDDRGRGQVDASRYFLVHLGTIRKYLEAGRGAAMVTGVVGGREFDLTKDEVIRTMRDVFPEPVREHFVVIGEKPFPPKQALAQVTGWDRQTFTSMEAIRVLTRVGFVCQRRIDGRPVEFPAAPEEPREHGTSPIDRRLSAMESAVAVMQEAIASLAKRVRELEEDSPV